MADFKNIAKSLARKIEEGGKNTINKIPDVVKATSTSAKKTLEKAKTSVITTVDQDGNGTIDSYDLILLALKVPGVKINRADFLQKELFKYCSQDKIDKAIAQNPAKAGIDRKLIDKIADEVIKFERNAVSGISTALGIPGGAAMVATIPADIAQYY